MLLQDYRTLDPPVGPTVGLQNAREILQDLWILRNRLRSSLHDIDFILTNQAQFRVRTSASEQEPYALKDLMLQVTAAPLRVASGSPGRGFPELVIPDMGELPQRKDGTATPPNRP